MRAATVVQGPGRCRRSRRTAGTPSYRRGNGSPAGVTPGAGSHHNAQPRNPESWAATAIDRSWRRRTTVAALISIFVVAAITFKFYRKFYCKFLHLWSVHKCSQSAPSAGRHVLRWRDRTNELTNDLTRPITILLTRVWFSRFGSVLLSIFYH